ncbi:ABC transporter permease subunit [Actinomarinicola tropica]|uniref:ABC transporter permease subunit n=1 Tax=Actinomarinicola tropica TaxID=2789776 RepID=A0A5Q2RRE3_9ACTN|nr:ABC transporter permease subunit [Actinomarinicola tropica]
MHRPGPSSRPARIDVVTVLGLLVAVGAALPLAFLLVRAREVGWSRSLEIATSDRALELLVDTTLLAVAVTAACLVIAVPLAWLTVRTDLPGRRAWTVLSALPLAIPTYVGGYTFVSALGPRGLVQGWLEPLGVDRLPEIYGFPGAWMVLTLFSYPYVLLPVRAALRRLDPSLEEASRTLGHGRLSTFVRVVVPQLRPAMTSGALLVALYALSDFGAVALLRFDSFTRVIFVQQRVSFDVSIAAVYGLMLVALTVAVLGLEQWTRGREQYHRLHGGGARLARTVHLGPWRWVAVAACAVLVLVALVLPLGVIVYWLQRGMSAGEPLRLTTDLVWGSVRASALGALGAVVAAWPIATLSVRRPGRLSRLVERLSWSGYALPGVVVALSLVYFGARYLPALYQTMWMLVFAYVVLFLPQAVGAIRSSMLQVTPSLEEASRLLGAGPFETFRRISVPLVRPGLTAGGMLVFLTCMKELPATLLLAPTGYSTLATQVYNATVEAFFARAAAPALALVVLAALPMAVLVLRENERELRPPTAQAEEETAEVGESVVR